ncbi:MAG: DNA-3-methyladenine glycosylase 2 family protein, partial [Acidimicrobiales bacterium]
MAAVLDLPPERYYQAVASRDRRFDGRFIVGVTSTGIYCRPSCPAPVRPKPENTRYFATAAAAQKEGFRSCKRCRPDATPGSPDWDTRADLVGRAMRLIADGAIDRVGVSGVAGDLAVSERHLHRLLMAEVGAGPIAIARAHRAQTARTLIETTSMKFADVAFASGFSSIRQFNDTIREVFDQTPRELRGRTGAAPGLVERGELQVRLPFRAPYAKPQMSAWVEHRTVKGMQWVSDGWIHRTLRLSNGPGLARLRFEDDYVSCALDLADLRDLATAVERCRRFLDLDADPTTIAESLSSDAVLRELVGGTPGLRAPGTVDGFETTVFAIVGQQVSVSAACAAMSKLVAAYGTPLSGVSGALSFPSPQDLLGADLAGLGLTSRSQRAIEEVARLAGSDLSLDPGADRDEVRERLLAVHGIGPWTADYVTLRALRDPDVLPTGDLVVRQAAGRLGLPASAAELAA